MNVLPKTDINATKLHQGLSNKTLQSDSRDLWPLRHLISICDTDYNTDNWEPGLMTIFVTWQLIVTLDSIRNSCDVYQRIQIHCNFTTKIKQIFFLDLLSEKERILMLKYYCLSAASPAAASLRSRKKIFTSLKSKFLFSTRPGIYTFPSSRKRNLYFSQTFIEQK